ncbi:hypothetical protein V1264_022084 [Littorina saxatilis]|uniref:WWE domain-containing protein n=2 Tax=Littorina saxatilis TaxID=31220 RepID=A0AAN9AJL9_9CAEN
MATSTSAKDRSAAKGVVVWEWFNESGKWRPYSPEVVAYIDKEVAQNASQVQLGIISQPLKMYTVDIPSMCQIRKGTGTSRPLRRVIYPEHSPPAQQVMWEFEGDQAGQWVPYDMEISHCLEHAHQGGHKMLDMHSLFQIPYSVHFTTMQQVRMNTGRARQIRRSPLQMPYPSASKSPKFLSRFSTVLPAFTLPPAVTQRASTSASAAPNLSSAGASGSGTQKRMMMLSSSDSSSDSDDSGMKRRARTRLHKKMKKVHIRGGSWGKKSSSGKSAAPPSATQTAGGSISSSSSNSSLTGSASGLMAPTPYRMPNVSLASAGPAMSLNLITYPQPLGANLSQGFPPMAHMPPSSSQPQAHSHQPAPSYHYNTQQGLQHSVLSLTHQGNPQASSQHQGASQSQSQAHVSASQAGSYISPAQSQSHSLGAPSAAHSHHTTHHSRLKVSQGYMSHSQVPPPSTSSSSWMGIPTTMMPASSLPSTSSMHSSLMAHPLTMTATAMSGQPLTAHSATQLQMASGMTYQGPLTRNRLHKQQQVVGPGAAGSGGSSSSSGGGGSSAGGGGMMGGQVLTSGMNGVHSMIGQIPHCYSSSQPHGYPGSKSGASQPGSHLSMSLRHLQQQQQQQMQQLQHQVPSMGSGSGYPFNLSSFVPTLGLNILPQSA